MHSDDTKTSFAVYAGASCPPGKIRREGYIATRKKKSFIGRLLKRGTTYRVNATCVTDRGAPGKGPVLIGPLRQGDLTSKGYSSKDSASQRHAALAKAVGAYGRLSTLRKLNAIAVLNKTTAPSRAKTFKTDRDWVKKTYF
jgi:hypothetical protein